MAAGGALPGWAVGLSIFGTYLSSNTFLGVPGKAFGENFNGFVFSLSLPLAAFIAARYFVPFYRQGGEISAYHHLEQRFGAWARTYAAVCYLLTQIARMGAILFGVALGLQALTGWDVTAIIVVTGVLVTLYTLLGGIEAVIWTDVAQSIILMGGAVLIFAMLLFGVDGGPSEIMQLAAQNEKLSLGSWGPALSESTVWVILFYGLFININNFGVDQSFVQRYHTADSDAAARRALWFGALLYVPIALLFFAIGAAAHSWYQLHPEELNEVRRQVAAERVGDGDPAKIEKEAAALKDDDIGDKVLPHFIANQLPVGLAGLLIAAIFAAAMSSVDTSLNSSATIVLKDIYQRYFDPNVSEKTSMTVLRTSTICAGLIGVGVAILMIGVKSILQAWWELQGVFAGGVLGLFLLGMASRAKRGAAPVIAVIIGVFVIAWLTLLPPLDDELQRLLHANLTIVVGTLTVFLIGIGLNALLEGSTIDTSAKKK